MPSILFVAYGGGHVSSLAPVYTELLHQGYDVTFLALTTARAFLDSKGLPSIGFLDHPCASDPKVLDWGHRLWDLQIQNCHINPSDSLVSKDESIAYLGLNYRDLVFQHGEKNADEIFSTLGRRSFEPRLAMRQFISHLSIDVVVATSAPRAEKAAILAAYDLNIPSLCLVDLFAVQEVRWLKLPHFATKLCVLNSSVRDHLIASGRNSTCISITGNPAFDELFNRTYQLEARKLRSQLQISDTHFIILWASQVEPEFHPLTGAPGDPLLPTRIRNTLSRFVHQYDQTTLIVRPHPSENSPEFQSDIFNSHNVHLCSSEFNIYALLYLCDVVVTMTSTVGVQADLLGKPVLALTCSVLEEDAPLTDMGVGSPVASVEELPDALLKLKDTYSFVDSEINVDRKPPQKSASTNVISELLSLLHST